jgi:plasmid stabilization system protein ParE
MFKVYLSPLAEQNIQDLLHYLETEWSSKAKNTFWKKLTSKFNQISNYPLSCIKSNSYPNLYKCVVSKQTSFFYRINENEIEIIALIDNRQDFDENFKNLIQ